MDDLRNSRALRGAVAPDGAYVGVRFINNARVAQIFFEPSTYAGGFFRAIIMVSACCHDCLIRIDNVLLGRA